MPSNQVKRSCALVVTKMPPCQYLDLATGRAVLCLIELFLPTAFVAFMMGISAFVVALVSLIFPS